MPSSEFASEPANARYGADTLAGERLDEGQLELLMRMFQPAFRLTLSAQAPPLHESGSDKV